jgi:hypothetical protein
MNRFWIVPALLCHCLTQPLWAQAPAAPPAVPLLDRLVGRWTVRGVVGSQPAQYQMDGTWTLQHRYVELHMQDVKHRPPEYEARVFIGADTVPGHVLAHWMDIFGAAYSVPPATGLVHGDSLLLDFPYPTGTFHDSFVLDRAHKTWKIRLDAADGKGGWKRFAEYQATPR